MLIDHSIPYAEDPVKYLFYKKRKRGSLSNGRDPQQRYMIPNGYFSALTRFTMAVRRQARA